MPALNPLQMLILADLYDRKEPISRYEAMANLNQVTTPLQHPYSPGAVYHSIKQLQSAKLIDFNQKAISISAPGRSALTQHLTQSEPPSSLLETLYQIIAIEGLADPGLRRIAAQRLRINMIKINQLNAKELPSVKDAGGMQKALKYCQSEIGKATERVLIELVG